MDGRRLRPWVQQFVAVCLVAVNMRMTISAFGPLLDQIAESEGVALASLGALGSIPLLAWALVSPLTYAIGRRLGMSRAITWSLVALSLGTLWRSLPGSPINLWLGTALIGAALAIANVLMPAIIKREFSSRVPLVMGVFSAIVALTGAIASGVMVPLSGVPLGGMELGWRGALLLSGVFAPVALVAWIAARRRRGASDGAPAGAAPGAAPDPLPGSIVGSAPASALGRRIWGEPLAWQIAIYMGAQSAVFYTLLTWLVAMEASQGRSPALAGIDTMTIQILSIGGSALTPLLFRGRLARWVPALLPLVIMAACVGFVLAPAHIPLWAGLCGVGLGAAYTMSLTLMAVRSADHATASAVSGMAQSVGYTFAAAGPLLFGWLHSVSGGWVAPMLLLVGVAALQTATGLSVGRPRHLFETAGARPEPRR